MNSDSNSSFKISSENLSKTLSNKICSQNEFSMESDPELLKEIYQDHQDLK